MQKTRIEWCDATLNPIIGCMNKCYYCYAKRMNDRFKWVENWNMPEWKHRWQDKLESIKKPSRIFMGSMTDLFGDWVDKLDIEYIIKVVSDYPQHRFLFLTKNPKRYRDFKFTDNCWLGTSVTGQFKYSDRAIELLSRTKSNKTFLSVEPLLDECIIWGDQTYKRARVIDWVIIGGLTPKPKHKQAWITRTVKYLKEQNIPLFIKNNCKYDEIIQQYPKELIL